MKAFHVEQCLNRAYWSSDKISTHTFNNRATCRNELLQCTELSALTYFCTVLLVADVKLHFLCRDVCVIGIIENMNLSHGVKPIFWQISMKMNRTKAGKERTGLFVSEGLQLSFKLIARRSLLCSGKAFFMWKNISSSKSSKIVFRRTARIIGSNWFRHRYNNIYKYIWSLGTIW